MAANGRNAGNGKVDALASTRIFGTLASTELRRLAGRFEPVTISGGATLLRKGDPADAVYLVVTGRLRAFATGPAGEQALDDIVPGDLVGELALLTDRPRSATVRAVRDSQLLRLTTDAFDEVVGRHPDVLRRMAGAMVERVADRLELPPPSPKRVRNIAVAPAGRTGPALLREVTDALVAGLGALGPTAVASSTDVEAAMGAGAAHAHNGDPRAGAVAGWLHRLEQDHDFVVHLADPTASEWTRRCLRQADRVLWVANGGDEPSKGPVEIDTAADAVSAVGTRHELALVHEPGTRPERTAAWLDARAVSAHHHLRRGVAADTDRLARLLTGKAVTVVLGGGGPRGYAHLGVLAALEDAGVPIDAIGGTSIGALMAAGCAMGWDASTRLEAATRLAHSRRLFGPTLPMVSLSSGRRLTALLQSHELFDGIRIEDLWLPFFCVSANLSTAEIVVHGSGPLWWAIRASISLPGILPPVFERGDLLVDGGVVNDLPVDVMHERIESRVVAVDLQPDVDLRAQEPFGPILSGWRVVARRLNPRARSYDVPHALAVMMRAKEIGGRRAQRAVLASRPADVHIRPPTDGFDALDFKAAAELIDVGFKHARHVLASDPVALQLPRTTRPTAAVASSLVPPVIPARKGSRVSRRPSPGFVWLASIRDLHWRRRRFLIAALGTALVFALTLLLSGFLESFDVEVDRSLAGLGNDGWVVSAGASGPFNAIAPVPADTAAAVAATPGVTAADPVVTIHHAIDRQPPTDVFVIGHRIGGLGAPGRVNGRAVAGPGEAVVDVSSVLDVGDRFSLGGAAFTVVGTVRGLTVDGGLPNVYLSIGDAQNLIFGGQPLATSILVTGRPTALPPGTAFMDHDDARADLLRPLRDTIDSIKMFRLLLWIVAGAIIGSVLYLSALERVGDFAVFKATGTSTVDLLGALAVQAMILSVIASVAAIGLAHLLAPQFPAAVSFPARLLALTPVVAVVVGLLASTAGLRRAVAADPALAFGGK